MEVAVGDSGVAARSERESFAVMNCYSIGRNTFLVGFTAARCMNQIRKITT